MTTRQPVLRLEGVSKAYGAKCALDDVSFQIGRGQFVALLGENGAGKTTLFQILTGLYTADRGTIEIAGIPLGQGNSMARQQIGAVFQAPTIDGERSAEANLLFHARLFGLSRNTARRRIDSLAAQFGFTDSLGQPMRTLSGGMRRRVELARALINAPALLLMDEPTVGLDPVSRRQLHSEVRQRCASENVSALWATHLVDEAATADQLLILHRGRLIAADTPQELLVRFAATDLTTLFMQITDQADSKRWANKT